MSTRTYTALLFVVVFAAGMWAGFMLQRISDRIEQLSLEAQP